MGSRHRSTLEIQRLIIKVIFACPGCNMRELNNKINMGGGGYSYLKQHIKQLKDMGFIVVKPYKNQIRVFPKYIPKGFKITIIDLSRIWGLEEV